MSTPAPVKPLARGPLRRRLGPDDIADGARRGVASIRALAQDRHALNDHRDDVSRSGS
ncbi:MAG: hypothetical protein ACR2HR_16560 [Euzebya sp.]